MFQKGNYICDRIYERILEGFLKKFSEHFFCSRRLHFIKNIQKKKSENEFLKDKIPKELSEIISLRKSSEVTKKKNTEQMLQGTKDL